jgi:hypothetical protein
MNRTNNFKVKKYKWPINTLKYLTSLAIKETQISWAHQWLMPVILATQEEEIRRITVSSQPRQIVCKTLS